MRILSDGIPCNVKFYDDNDNELKNVAVNWITIKLDAKNCTAVLGVEFPAFDIRIANENVRLIKEPVGKEIRADLVRTPPIIGETIIVKSPPDGEDVALWADGTYCFVNELSDFSYMSDDYEIVPFGTDRHKELTEA